MQVRGGDGPVADVVVDSVVALNGRRVSHHLHELEVELIDGSDKDLERIEGLLRDAGAQAGDRRPKVFQVLGLDLPVPGVPVPPTASPMEHVTSLLQTQVTLLLVHDPGTRLGTDEEELHQMRVATRRLRAYLRAARPMLAPDWVANVRTELAWLGSTLGPVRDLDVLLGHLDKECATLHLPERRAVELEHSPQLAAGFASAFEKYSKLSSVIPRSLLRGASSSAAGAEARASGCSYHAVAGPRK